jgi:hypothetical protein
MTGNRYGMGTEEQVREFETWLRSEPDRYLLACLGHPGLPEDQRTFIEWVLKERPRGGAERAVLQSLIEDRRKGARSAADLPD